MCRKKRCTHYKKNEREWKKYHGRSCGKKTAEKPAGKRQRETLILLALFIRCISNKNPNKAK
jgi:hypothetical protein